MNKNLLKTALFGALVTSLAIAGCSKNDGPDPETGGENDGTRYITLTGAYPEGTSAGDGGTLAYAITHENVINPNYEIDLFKQEGEVYVNGFTVKSSRTARVQASADGRYLYNIQYGNNNGLGGVFNRYSVTAEGKDAFKDMGVELNTAPLLSTSPRWTKAAEGIGIGVYAGAATLSYTGQAPNFVYQNRDSEVKIVSIDLNNVAITNTAVFNFPWSAEERAAGYGVGRVDVPVLNSAKTKVFIGCNVSKVNPAATPTVNASGVPSWPTDPNVNGTKTLVLDYPSLRNPKVITSKLTKLNNHGYRTQTQYVGTDGHVYQAVMNHTNGSQFTRINSATNDYDDYLFDLNDVLGAGVGIAAWTYIKDGVGIVLYRQNGKGGHIALVDLNAKTATKLATDLDAVEEWGSTLTQYQNIGVNGDFAYVPLTPSGKDGNVYVVNWKTKSVVKGAKLKGAAISHFIGSF